MKKIIVILLAWLCITAISLPAYSQGYMEYRFSDITVSMSYPDTWDLSREHILLLLMPKNKEITVEIELLGEDLNEIIRSTMENIINVYPNDTNIIRKDFKINGLNATEITLKTQDLYVVNYLFLVSPKKKILKFFCNATEEEMLKFKNEIKHIKENFSPIK